MGEYPFHKDLRETLETFTKGNGNFGLWYNKLIPIRSFNEPYSCDKQNNKDNKTDYYKNQYDLSRNNDFTGKLLLQKHCVQMHYCQVMETNGYTNLVFKADLKSSLITGLGETHPGETSLVLDHIIGIPYIPSTSIKGITRFAHSFNLMFDEEGNFSNKFIVEKKDLDRKDMFFLDESNQNTLIPGMFGGDSLNQEKGKIKKVKGEIIFLDAYPENVPELHQDIMNPHYDKYYGDKAEAPGDYCDPVPIKFLTVKKNTSFVFRVLVPKEKTNYLSSVKHAFSRALEKEGIGAKTSVGYGRFMNISEKEPSAIKQQFEKYLKEKRSAEDNLNFEIKDFIKTIETLKKGDNSLTDTLFNKWTQPDFSKYPDLEKNEKLISKFTKNKEIASAFKDKIKKKKASNEFTHQYKKVAKVLGLPLDMIQETNKSQLKKPSVSMEEKEKIQKKLSLIITKGSISSKEKKKIMKNHKKDFPDLWLKIKKLPVK